MGLIKAALGAAGGVLADQWKEYFYCEAIPANILAVKGKKRTSGRSSNTKGSDNIISNGSVIAVAPARGLGVQLWCGEQRQVLLRVRREKARRYPQYRCDKYSWEPEDPAHPPKFCPECGDPFDDGDLK